MSSDPFSVENLWLHDLGVTENAPRLTSDAIAEYRAAGEESLSDGERILERIEETTGQSLDEWLGEIDASADVEMWHVPAWLCDKRGLPLQDEDLGSILLGVPYRKTDKGVKFNRAEGVFALEVIIDHGGARRQELCRALIDDWEEEIQSCVEKDNWSFRWIVEERKSTSYYPLSELTRIR